MSLRIFDYIVPNIPEHSLLCGLCSERHESDLWGMVHFEWTSEDDIYVQAVMRLILDILELKTFHTVVIALCHQLSLLFLLISTCREFIFLFGSSPPSAFSPLSVSGPTHAPSCPVSSSNWSQVWKILVHMIHQYDNLSQDD